MIIIFKDDFDSYRYAAGKAAFLLEHPIYSLVENYPRSNCMVVWNKESNQEEVISMFRKPTMNVKKFKNRRIIVISEKKPWGSNAEEYTYSIANLKMSLMFKRTLFDAIYAPRSFFSELEPEIYERLFSELIIEKPDFEKVKLEYPVLYKYYRIQRIEDSPYLEQNGFVSFYNPSAFNDPFDCNCVFAKTGENAGDSFRVLCTAPEYDNILMWAYYAEDHKGYCFGYSTISILEAISKCRIDGLCFVGHVDYKDARPVEKIPQSITSFSDMKFYIDASFTKYKRWEHENEYRFVIVSNNFPNDGEEWDYIATQNHISMQVCINEVYRGCKALGVTSLNHCYVEPISVTQLHEDPKEYKLV